MTCGKCGAFLKEGSKFCTYCGQKLPEKMMGEAAGKKILCWGFWVNVVKLVGIFFMLIMSLVLPRIIQNLDIPLPVAPRSVLPLVIQAAAAAVLLLLLGCGAFARPEKSDARWKPQGVLFIGYGLFQGYYFVVELLGTIHLLNASTAALWQQNWQSILSGFLQGVNEFLLFFLLFGMGISFLCKKLTVPYGIVKPTLFTSMGLTILCNLLTFLIFTKTYNGTGMLTYAGVHFNYTNLLNAAFAVLTLLSFLILYRRLAESRREGAAGERTAQSKKDGTPL